MQGGSGITESLETLLAHFAKSNGKRPRLVHRLDRETSGLIIAARTKPAAAFLSQAFAERRVQKIYHAIVCGGAPDPRVGAIDLPLRKITRNGIDLMEIAETRFPELVERKQTPRPPSTGSGKRGVQAARTLYRTLASTPHAAFVELDPETGRMHQLRAHLAALGRPIAGDGKYGGLFAIDGTPIPRLMLHAAQLTFPHPDGGARTLEAALPAAFTETLQALAMDPLPASPFGRSDSSP